MPNEIQKLPDGRISAKLETGEVFEGDAIDVTTKLAEAQVNTKRWGQGFKQELETLKATPPPPTSKDSQPPVDQNEVQLQAYLLTQNAKALGYNSAEEYKADLARVKDTADKTAKNLALQDFFSRHPEYPGTEAANDFIGKIFDKHGWELNAENLHFAHLEAMDLHRKDPSQGYEPLSAAEINSQWANNMANSNRQAPPPMLRSSSPDSRQQGVDPYAMKLDDLRAAAINQELSRK